MMLLRRLIQVCSVSGGCWFAGVTLDCILLKGVWINVEYIVGNARKT